MTDQDPSDAEMQRVCAILETISKTYPIDSDEANAIRDAALAYTIVHQHEALKKKLQELATFLWWQTDRRNESRSSASWNRT